MQKLASDLDSPQFVGASNPDDQLHVHFYSRPVYQAFQSQAEGRAIYKDCDMVKIHMPGNQLNNVDTFVDDTHKARFPRQWAHYKNTKSGGESYVGTPVSEWPMITASRAMELKAMKFFTVEQIANASDQQIQALGMDAAGLRLKAQRFLQLAKGEADDNAMQKELKKRDEQIAELMQKVEALSADKNAAPAPASEASVEIPQFGKQKRG